MRFLFNRYRIRYAAATLVLLFAVACASAGSEPAEEPLKEVAAASQCSSQTGGPCFTPFTKAPALANQENVVKAMTRRYPKKLREQSISGTPVLWLFVDEKGNVQKVQLKRTSGYPELDSAARQIGRIMRFEPALDRNVPVKVWVEIPIEFRAR